MNLPDNIILCGFMGTGKTTVGQEIAVRLGWQFVDTDKLIEERCGKTVREIFAEDGEAAFRQMERDLCGDMLNWHKTVVATGGGIVLNPNNRQDLEAAGLVVCLEAPAQEIVSRLAGNTDRPLLAGDDPAGRVQELLTQRREAYAALSYHVNTAGKSPGELAEQIVQLWRKQVGQSEDETEAEPKADGLKLLFGLNLPVDNPIYKYDIRDLRWLKGATSPQRWGWTRLLVVYLVTILLSMLAVSGSQSEGYSYFLFTVAGLAGFAGGIYSLIADVRYVMMTTSAISNEIVMGQWDILRLTNLDERDIIGAKHAAAIVRCWRVMTVERAVVSASPIAQAIFYVVAFSTLSLSFGYRQDYIGLRLVPLIPGFFMGLILPYRRMRAITALGLGLSTRIISTTYSILAGFAIAFFMRLFLWIIGAMISFGLFFALGATSFSVTNSGNISTGFIAYSLIVAVIPAVIDIGFYIVTEIAARRYTARSAFYSDRQP